MSIKIFFPLEVFYPSQAGGVANSVYWITKELLKQGFEPVIVATNKGIQPNVQLNKWLRTDYGKVIYVKTLFSYFPLFQTLVSLFNFYRTDIVHISSFFFPTAFLTAFAARLLKKKMVWSATGELDTLALNHSRLRKSPILWCIRKIIGTYPIYHSTCDGETQYIKNVFGDDAKIVQIPNYFEIPPKVEREASKYLLYIGRIHPKKAIDNLIRAIALSEDFLKSDFVLKIAGTGKKKFEDDLCRLVEKLSLSDKVIFVGQIENEGKQKLLADAYFTVMPSHTENFGIVVLESLAQETPVIASKGSPWESLEIEKTGFWVENSPEELSWSINKILRMDKSEYEGFRRRCRKFVIRDFDIKEKIGKWIEVYRSLK